MIGFYGIGGNSPLFSYENTGTNWNYGGDGGKGSIYVGSQEEKKVWDCSGNKRYNPSTKTCECPEGMVDNGYECVEAVEVINKLTGKAKCVYEKMVDGNNNINWILNNFNDGNKPSQFDLRFEMSTTLGNETNASTIKSGNTFIIKINQSRAENNNTVLTIARTIIHEEIHARLREFASRKGSSETSFPGIYDYYRRHGKNWDHQQMASHYRNTIAEGLKQFDNSQHPDAYYDALAWEGLSEIKDLNGTQDKIYTEAWKKLSSAEQQEILNAIRNEKQNGSKTCKK